MPGGGYCDNNTSQPNWRLWFANWAELGKISVLCRDYKCLETILANRLTIAMGSFISSSQYASKPRKIHQGVAVARDVVNYACIKNVNMACVTLDMKSGLDLDRWTLCTTVWGGTDFLKSRSKYLSICTVMLLL